MAEPATNTPQANLSDLLSKPEVQNALTTLMEQLPKLAPAVVMLGKACEVASEALKDGDFVGGIEETVLETVRPVQAKAQEAVAIVQEANQRAQRSTNVIGVFGVMRLLKEPAIQRGLRFAQALCEVTEEHRRRSDNVKTPQ